MNARYGYRFDDGSVASYNDSKTYPDSVSRVQVTPGLADELAKVVSNKHNPDAIARTETTRAYNDGTVEAAKGDEFVKGFQFLGVNDERQSEICNYLDGTVIDKLDPRVSDITPPMHVFCRSRLVEVMVTSNKVANIDTRTVMVDGEKKRIADLDTRFGKAGSGQKIGKTIRPRAVEHPGIYEPREWSITLANMRIKPFADAIQAAINKALGP